MSNYFLTIRAMGNQPMVKIDESEFEKIRIASTNLRHILDIEEQWAALVENYFDLERSLLEAAARHMIMPDVDWHAFHDAQLRFAVKLANLLSTCRAYLDQTDRHLKMLAPMRNDRPAFEAARKNQYDGRFAYRFMEALRNVSQHSGLPLHGTSYGIQRDDGDQLAFWVATTIDLDELRSDSKFKSNVLEGVSEASLSAEPLIREYVAGLSTIHMAVRAKLAERVDGWKGVIRDAISKFSEGADISDQPPGLCAMQTGSDGDWTQQVHLGEQKLQRIEMLQKRHRSLERVSESFVSGAKRANVPNPPVAPPPI